MKNQKTFREIQQEVHKSAAERKANNPPKEVYNGALYYWCSTSEQQIMRTYGIAKAACIDQCKYYNQVKVGVPYKLHVFDPFTQSPDRNYDYTPVKFLQSSSEIPEVTIDAYTSRAWRKGILNYTQSNWNYFPPKKISSALLLEAPKEISITLTVNEKKFFEEELLDVPDVLSFIYVHAVLSAYTNEEHTSVATAEGFLFLTGINCAILFEEIKEKFQK